MTETIQSAPQTQPEGNSSFIADLYDWAEAVVFSLAFVVLLFTFIFRIVGVDGPSMLNTLQDGNRLIICNINYTPKHGDIVVLPTKDESVKKPLIKRIIAVGGDTVDINYGTNQVFVNGKAQAEPYIKDSDIIDPSIYHDYDPTKMPITVPKGYVFVMGDNRNNSLDSRSSHIGMIDSRYIMGKVIWRLFPFDEFGSVK